MAGQHLHDWIEESADRLYTQASDSCAPYLSVESYKPAFGISDVNVVPYGHSPRFSAGIRLKEEGHQLSVLRVSGPDRRALIAHELGHAMLYNHRALWDRISRRKLIVDPSQERLVDDIARSLLAPKSMLDEVLIKKGYPKGEDYSLAAFSDMFEEAVRTASVPIRLVLARILQFGTDATNAFIYLTVPLQRELFAPVEVRAQRLPQTKWIIKHQLLQDSRSETFYPFVDFEKVGKELTKIVVDQIASSAANHVIDPAMILPLLRKSDRRLLTSFSSFTVLRPADAGGVRHCAILCRM